MEIIVSKNYDELSKKAASFVIDLIKEKPDSVLGLATGGTPEGMYAELVKAYEAGKISFKDVRTYNLDEYIGLDGNHEQSYRHFMNKQLFDHVDIDKNNTYVPNGKAEDLEAECENYEKILKDLSYADIQILGIGTNGHIGFNEPAEELILPTHVEPLVEATIEANSRYFDSKDEVPKEAISMGIGSILKAKHIILLASGPSKNEIMKYFNNDKISTNIPASLIKLHPNVTIIMDEEAAK
ncbi:glucosamine-6-phosphate deaminase [Helcococcus massiliensis]|uniref:glucosamine-6-phosphate deaminase n=1 Tax=Helcococcus massiliensis TaxID=2040290 RepID=UPI000CDEC82B|nr:glucosamine-6-phosphate deaminase [Helcococcus massiliensis]